MSSQHILDPSATQATMTALKSKQQFYYSQNLGWSLFKSVDGLDVSIARIQLNSSLISSLSGTHECIVVRIRGHIPHNMARILADMKSDEITMKNDPAFKMNKTVCTAIVGRRPSECVWLRNIGIKSPLPLIKDQQVISLYYQNLVTPQAPYNNGVCKTTEILSGSLTDVQLKALLGPATQVCYENAYAQGHEIFTQVRLTPVHEAPSGAPENSSITHLEHFGVYSAPGKPSIIYEGILADTILRKYTNIIKAYAK